MNILDRFARVFGFSKQTLTADQVMDAEAARVQPTFKAHFDPQYGDYLKTDYARFVEQDYPEYVRQRYPYLDPKAYPYPERPCYGLALSGGGIRSASFGIGVIQALRNKFFLPGKPSLFERLVYQSSVSGGGYAGAALQWYQKRFNFFPFGNIDSFAGSQYSQAPEDKTLSHIRQHGKYLTPHQLGASSLVGVILMSSIHSVTAYTLLLTLLLFLAIAVISLVPTPGIEAIQSLLHAFIYNEHQGSEALNLGVRADFSYFFLLLASLSALSFIVLTFGYALSSFTKHWFSKAYCYRIAVQKWLGRLLVGIGVALFFAVLPLAFTLAVGVEPDLQNDQGAMATSLASALFGGILVIFNFYRSVGTNFLGTQQLIKLLTVLFVGSAVLFIFLLAYGVAEYIYIQHQISLLMLLVLALPILVLVNLNQISPHKMYRDRLMETFMETPELPPEVPFCQRTQAANDATLASLERSSYWSPYHLVNCNIILNNAVDPRFRGRAGDSFLLSSLYSGSDATQYIPTDRFAGGDLTLASAMAISGAAANPYAGNSGEGASLNPLIAFLMTFLGLRLGYWAFSPATALGGMEKKIRPNYLLPGLHSLLDFGHSERSLFVELSDGGHFDNTGLYELIRRRIPVIILSDGGADPKFSFDDLGNAIERVRVDFGVSIRLDDDFGLEGLMPGSQAAVDRQSTISDQRFNLSERGYALGDILYPETARGAAFVGRLVYIKAALTRDLPVDLYAYKAANPDYPDQPTLDQFFDERQFEAYRELGYQLTHQMLANKKVTDLLP